MRGAQVFAAAACLAFALLLVAPARAQGVEYLTGWQLAEKDASGRYLKFVVVNRGSTSATVDYVGYYFAAGSYTHWVDVTNFTLVINENRVVDVPEAYRGADRIYVLTTRGQIWSVRMRPIADFTYSPPQPAVGTTIYFSDNSRDKDGWIVSWSWSFGDGATASTRNPTKQYSQNGIYSVTLTVTDDDGLSDSKTVLMNVGGAPDFSLGANPSSGTVAQGGSTNTTITVTSVNGFSGSVSLSASGLPSGASASFSTNPVSVPANSSASATMTITTSSSTPTGSYAVTVTGTSGSLTRTTSYTLSVSASGGGSYLSVSVSPSSGSVQRGSSVGAAVSVNSNLSGVSLSASNVPYGVSVSFSPSSGSGDFSSTMTISTTTSASPGTYYITVSASSGGYSSTTTYTLAIYATRIAVTIDSLDAPAPSSAQVTVGSVTKTVYAGSTTYWDVGPGNYTVSFGSVNYYRTPSSQVVTVSSGQTASVTGYYNIGKWRFLQAGDAGFIAAQSGIIYYRTSDGYQWGAQDGKATIGLGWNNGDQFWTGGAVNILVNGGGLFTNISYGPTSTTPNASGSLITIDANNTKVTGAWSATTYPRLSGTSVNFPGYGGEGNRSYQDVGWSVYFIN